MDAMQGPLDSDEYPIEQMPARLRTFLDPGLADDPGRAGAAADQIWYLLREVVALQVQLEWVERGLRDSEGTDQWRQRAITELRSTADGFEAVVTGVSNAEDAVRFQKTGD